MNKVKVARYRKSPYFVNHITDGGTKAYSWSGSKGNKVDTKEIPEEVIDRLMMESVCFRDGELVIIEEDEKSKDLVANIDDLEEYRNNTHSKEEVIKILEGNYKKMETELNKITNKDEKKFIVEVAKEINVDSNAKLNILATWYGVKRDILFGE